MVDDSSFDKNTSMVQLLVKKVTDTHKTLTFDREDRENNVKNEVLSNVISKPWVCGSFEGINYQTWSKKIKSSKTLQSLFLGKLYKLNLDKKFECLKEVLVKMID